MPISNPLMNGFAQGVGSAGAGASGGAAPSQVGPQPQVSGRLAGTANNTPQNVAVLVLLGLGIIVVTNLAGFRFSFAAGAGLGGS